MDLEYRYLTIKAADHQVILAELTRLDAIIQSSPVKGFVLGTVLFGSYPRSTMIPNIAPKALDVDVLVITTLGKDWLPHQLRDTALPIFGQAYATVMTRNRSISLVTEFAKVDLVFAIIENPAKFQHSSVIDARDSVQHIYAAASADENWTYVPFIGKTSTALSPLFIADFANNTWVIDDPLQQILWTKTMSERTLGSYLTVVKLFKLIVKLHALNNPAFSIYSYPVERLVGYMYPKMVSQPVLAFLYILEGILQEFRSCVAAKQAPSVNDVGLAHNVFAAVSVDSFRGFYDALERLYEHLDRAQIREENDIDRLIHQIMSIYQHVLM